MRILEGEEKAKAKLYLDMAAEAAANAFCHKSQRGVVIVQNEIIISEGYNAPPDEDVCSTCLREEHPEKTHTEPCRAVHAEERAIFNAYKNGIRSLEGAIMFHIKIKGGEKVPSGKPSCVPCARAILENNISEFVLLHKEGITAYTARENYDLSLESLEKPPNP